MHKDPAKRYASCAEFAAELTRVYQVITSGNHDAIAQQERLGILRRLNFFHDFAHIEIRELLDAGEWREYHKGDEIVKEGEMDDRFYVIVAGNCVVESNGITVGEMMPGNCFGESSYVSGTRRTATIRAQDEVTVLSVSATLLEQLSTDCQLRFTKVFLMQLIRRLQGIDAS
jgi:serine/threonine-protein kinase